MLSQIKRWVAPPIFEDEEKSRVAAILNIILLTILAASVPVIIIGLQVQNPNTLPAVATTDVIVLISLWLVHRGHLTLPSYLIPLMMLGVITCILYGGQGIHDITMPGYVIAIALASLLLGRNAPIIFTLLCVVFVVAIYFAEIKGLIVTRFEAITSFDDIISIAVILGITAVLLRVMMSNLLTSLERARRNEHALAESNRELKAYTYELARREEVLRESEERYRSLFTNNHSTMLLIDPQTADIVDANPAACVFYGYSKEELIRKKITEINTLSREQVFQEMERAKQEQRQHFFFRHRLSSGEIRDVEVYSGPIKMYGRQLLYSIIHDITERKRVEEALQESEERFRSLVKNSSDIITVFTADGITIYQSPSLKRILGYEPEELTSVNGFEYIHPDDVVTVWNAFTTLIQQGGISIPIEYRFRHTDGSWVHVESIGSNHLDGPVIKGVIVNIRDITERKRAEEQLQRYAAELEEANVELSQYAYVVSHDLKAPLRAIRNYADFLCEDLEATLEDEQKTYLDGLNRAVQEANALVEDLLQLSRIGQHSIDVETIEVGSFLQSLISSLDLPTDIEIIMEDDWPTLDTEPVLLRQVFQNLINNVVKFNTSPQKCVELGWRSVEQDRYEFFVHDNGIGIDPDHHEKIFRVFERLHTKEEFEGTGIGLAIVKKAIGKLGGSVRVESQPGEGSTFFVNLPKTTTNLG